MKYHITNYEWYTYETEGGGINESNYLCQCTSRQY
jgi:hypothetical protein